MHYSILICMNKFNLPQHNKYTLNYICYSKIYVEYIQVFFINVFNHQDSLFYISIMIFPNDQLTHITYHYFTTEPDTPPATIVKP